MRRAGREIDGPGGENSLRNRYSTQSRSFGSLIYEKLEVDEAGLYVKEEKNWHKILQYNLFLPYIVLQLSLGYNSYTGSYRFFGVQTFKSEQHSVDSARCTDADAGRRSDQMRRDQMRAVLNP
jgi:hypothetical protein